MNKKIIIALFIIIGGGLALVTSTKLDSPKEFTSVSTSAPTGTQTDHKASFAIFIHGTFRVFTAPMYHNLSKDVFIQVDHPNIIHVKKAGITWQDFFKTLPMKVTKDCLTTGTGETFCNKQDESLKFYLNGDRNDNLLDTQIDSGDQALITFGNESDLQIQNQVQQVPKAEE